MADTKLTDLTALTLLDGTEDLYAVQGATPYKVNGTVLKDWLAESKTLYGVTADDTPTSITDDGSNTEAANGFQYNRSGAVGITRYEVEVIAYVSQTDYFVARSVNAVLYDPGAPSASLLSADTFTTEASLGSGTGMTAATVVDPATGYIYIEVEGDPVSLAYWTIRITPLRSIV